MLVRTNAEVATTAEALKRAGIPCATAQAGLLSTPDAVLAMARLRRLNDPNDTLASAEIISLADSVDPEVWVADRLRYLAAGGDPANWREHRQRDPAGASGPRQNRCTARNVRCSHRAKLYRV